MNHHSQNGLFCVKLLGIDVVDAYSYLLDQIGSRACTDYCIGS